LVILGTAYILAPTPAFSITPTNWTVQQVDLWTAAGWGWAMWNFTGSMGIIDSDRADVEYENWHGHKLDREMLTLVQGWKRE
jgi:hypothetical protein